MLYFNKLMHDFFISFLRWLQIDVLMPNVEKIRLQLKNTYFSCTSAKYYSRPRRILESFLDNR